MARRLTEEQREIRDFARDQVIKQIVSDLGKHWREHYTERVQEAIVSKYVMRICLSWMDFDRRNELWRDAPRSEATMLFEIQMEAFRQLGLTDED
jgi:hypothetical protein